MDLPKIDIGPLMMPSPSKLGRLVEGINAMPEDMRRLFDDCFVANKSAEQIAEETGVSPQALEASTVQLIRELKRSSGMTNRGHTA